MKTCMCLHTGPTIDLSVAADLVQSLTATLKDVRDDSDFISGIIFDAGTR